MSRAAPLDLVIQHVTAQNRPRSHGAILVREIERLRAESDRHDTPAWQANELLNGLVERLSFGLELIRDMPSGTEDASERMRGIARDALTAEPATAKETTDV